MVPGQCCRVPAPTQPHRLELEGGRATQRPLKTSPKERQVLTSQLPGRGRTAMNPLCFQLSSQLALGAAGFPGLRIERASPALKGRWEITQPPFPFLTTHLGALTPHHCGTRGHGDGQQGLGQGQHLPQGQGDRTCPNTHGWGIVWVPGPIWRGQVRSSREKVKLELPMIPVQFRNTSLSLGKLSGNAGKGHGFS